MFLVITRANRSLRDEVTTPLRFASEAERPEPQESPTRPNCQTAGRRTCLLLGRQDSPHCAKPGMAGGFSVKVEVHGEDCRLARMGGGGQEAGVAWPCGGRTSRSAGCRAALLLAWSETAAGIFPRLRLAVRPNPSPRRVVYPTVRAVHAPARSSSRTKCSRMRAGAWGWSK